MLKQIPDVVCFFQRKYEEIKNDVYGITRFKIGENVKHSGKISNFILQSEDLMPRTKRTSPIVLHLVSRNVLHLFFRFSTGDVQMVMQTSITR